MPFRRGTDYPHIRKMRLCLTCGHEKTIGALVCWDCHNNFSYVHDHGYGPDTEWMLHMVETEAERIAERMGEEC